MKRSVLVLALAAAILLLLPAIAGAWQVRNNAGEVVGKIAAGDNDWGVTVGLIFRPSSDDPIANVLRVVQDDYDGWMLINGTSDVDWVGGILRRSSVRYTLGRAGGDHPTARAIKVSSGRYWALSRKSEGSWHRIGSVRGGCRGAWAVGAARKLLW